MTPRRRAELLELACIVVALFLLAIVAPGLINQHDTMLTYAAFIMLAGAVGWCTYFIYRLMKEEDA